MLNRRITALILVGAIALGLGGASVLAADQGPVDSSAPAQTDSQTPPDAAAPEAQPPAQTDQPAAADAPREETEPAADETPKSDPDPAGTLSFASLEQRVRENCLNYLILEESIARVEANDYDKMKEDLRDALNGIANAQWQMQTAGSQIDTGDPGLNAIIQGMMSASASGAAATLQTQYDALREQFDDLKDGKLQQDMADVIRQLRATQDGIIMVTQSMYVQLSELRATDAALDRALVALDRQIQEMELRYGMGQISALTLQQLKGGRTALVSQRQTLATSAQTLSMNLETMVGAELGGDLRLTALPKVSGKELAAMDLEADLAAAKEASYQLYAAKKTLDDAQEDYKDAGKEYGYNEKKYQFVQAQHAWQAAQYTYDAAVQSFELSFRTLYSQVKDSQQALAAARTALAVEQDNFAVDQLKYEQGSISKNALLTAQDDLSTAQDKVATAERTLFSAYNNYRWAVDHGVLN